MTSNRCGLAFRMSTFVVLALSAKPPAAHASQPPAKSQDFSVRTLRKNPAFGVTATIR